MAKKKIAKKTPGFDFAATPAAPAPAPVAPTRGREKSWTTREIIRLFDTGLPARDIMASIRANGQCPDDNPTDDDKFMVKIRNVIAQTRKERGQVTPRKSGGGVLKKVARPRAPVASPAAGGARVGGGSLADQWRQLVALLGRDGAIKALDALE